jgi:proteasome alpha subunit
MKPMEVEILVAEVGAEGAPDQLFHILYDGTVMDERRFSVLGGDAEAITSRLTDLDSDKLSLGDAVAAATQALCGPDRTLKADDLEVAVLARSNGRRCFRRLADDEVAALIAG